MARAPRRLARVVTAVLVALVVGLLGGSYLSAAASGQAASASQPTLEPEISRYAAIVDVRKSGMLHIAEAVTYDFQGRPTAAISRTITTRERYDADNDRVYDVTGLTVRAVEAEATASVSSTDATDTVDVSFAEPRTQQVSLAFEYNVRGAVAATPDGLEVRWPVVQGFDVSITDATVQWNAGGVVWLSCLAGAPGTSKPCTTAQLMEVSRPTMRQQGLRAGDEMVGILGLSAASGVTADADLQARWSLARGFTASGTPLEVALVVLALGLLAALALWWLRGRDSHLDDTAVRSPLLDRGESSALFAPPSGVRPGQMGTLVDERADLVDVSATVIDLAIRNYLFVEELPDPGYGRRDWLLHRRNEPGDELLPYEREIFQALFLDSSSVRVSELGDQLRSRLPAIQALMYDDMVDQGWFAERPDSVRSRWSTAGWVLLGTGAVLTVVLALAGTFGLVGVAVVLAGAALAASGQLAPARTSKGRRVLNELPAFRAYLESPDVTSIPPSQREELISRFLPYALVFGLGDRWAAALTALDEDPDPDEPLYWYGAPADWHLSDAAPSLLQLSDALSAALAHRRLLGV